MRAEPSSTRGSILTRNATFLTKKALFTMAFVPLVSAFDIKNQGTMPQMSHKKKGVPLVVGPDRKPISKTNHITTINVKG